MSSSQIVEDVNMYFEFSKEARLAPVAYYLCAFDTYTRFLQGTLSLATDKSPPCSVCRPLFQHSERSLSNSFSTI